MSIFLAQEAGVGRERRVAHSYDEGDLVEEFEADMAMQQPAAIELPENPAEVLDLPGPDISAIEVPKSGKFRLQAYKVFITYPDCNLSREQVAAAMRMYWEPALVQMEKDPNFIQDASSEAQRRIEWMVVGQELHTKPGPRQGHLHLHVALSLTKRCNIRSQDVLDLPGRNPSPADKNQNAYFHPKMEPMRDPVAAVRYCVAEDKTPLVWRLDLAKHLEQGAGKLDRMAMKAYEGAEGWAREIVKLHPGLFMIYQQKLEGMQRLGKRTRDGPPRAGWVVIAPREQYRGQPGVLDYIRIPLNQPRRMKQFQYYIWAPPNHGKTTLKERMIAAGFRGYEIPRNNDFKLWEDDYFSFAYADEYNANYISPTDINRFSDGSFCVLNVKGGIVEKGHNITVLLMSNVKIDDCYKQAAPRVAAPPPPPAPAPPKGKQRPRLAPLPPGQLQLAQPAQPANAAHNAVVEGFMARFRNGYIDGTVYDLFGATLHDEYGVQIEEVGGHQDGDECCLQCAKYFNESTPCDCVGEALME